MPRDIDDDEPIAKPKKGTPKKPARAPDEPGGALKPLLITFGCVAVAFAGIMAFVLMKAPTATDVAIGDPTNSPGPFVPPGGVLLSPFDSKPQTPGVLGLQPDDWTPPKYERPTFDAPPGTMTAVTADPAVKPVLGQIEFPIADLDDARLLFTGIRGGKLRVFDYAPAANRELPVPPQVSVGFDARGSVSPDGAALFVTGGGAVHRFDVAGRSWARKSVQASGVVAAVAADRFLAATQGPGPNDHQLRLFRWDNTRPELVPVAEAVFPRPVFRVVYDPAAGVAYAHVLKYGANASSLHVLRVTGGGLTEVAAVELPFDINTQPKLSWDGQTLFFGNRVFAVPERKLRDEPFPWFYASDARDFVVTEDGHLRHPKTGASLSRKWSGQFHGLVSRGGTGYWAHDGKNAYTRYTITTAPVAPPTDPKTPAAGAVKVTELAALPGPATGVNAFRYCDKSDLLLFTNTVGLTILDAKTGNPLPAPKSDQPVRAGDLAPDGSAAFATNGQTLFRYDVAAKTWESRPFTGNRILALDGKTVLAQMKFNPPPTEWAVVKWDAEGVVEVGRTEWGGQYELGYDPAAKAVYAIHSATRSPSNSVFERYAVTADGLKSEWSRKLPAAVAPSSTLRPLSGDGSVFVNSRCATGTQKADGPVVTAVAPTRLVGATKSVVVESTGKLRALANGQEVGTLGHPADALTPASPDGATVWVLNIAAKKFVKYRIDAEKK